MSRIAILDPTATPPSVDPEPGPPLEAATLTSGRFGIRYEMTWRSFLWVKDEWNKLLTEGGAQVSEWCAGDRTGEAGDATLAELEHFSRQQEVVISGLGN